MKFLAPITLLTNLAGMTILLLPASPVTAAVYQCDMDARFEYSNTVNTLTSAQRSYALGRVGSSYLAVHQQNYPGYTVPSTPTGTWTITPLATTLLSWNPFTNTVHAEDVGEQPEEEENLDQQQLEETEESATQNLRGNQTFRWLGSYVSVSIRIGCNVCGGSLRDDDTIPPGMMSSDMIDLSATNIERWKLAWCDELRQNPAYPFMQARNCNLVFKLATCKLVREDGEEDEDEEAMVVNIIGDAEETVPMIETDVVSGAADIAAVAASSS